VNKGHNRTTLSEGDQSRLHRFACGLYRDKFA
jgi:hypothetical protein